MVSVIIVNYNGERFLGQCLQSLVEKTQGAQYEVILVDNASTDNGLDLVRKKFPIVRIIRNNTNLGFSVGNNLGVKASSGDYLLFLNNDTYFHEDSISVMSEVLDRRKDVAVLGPRLAFADGRHQLSCGFLPNICVELIDKIRYSLDAKFRSVSSEIHDAVLSSDTEVGWVTGACIMVRRDVFEGIGGFDENMFMYFEDKDLCKRVRDMGRKVLYSPRTSVVHLLGGSSTIIPKSIVNARYRTFQQYYYAKHLGMLQQSLLSAYLKISGKI